MVAQTSHDMRTPINSIISMLDILENSTDIDEQKQYI